MSIIYPLYDLTSKEFEDLIVIICERILGIGTVCFSTGKDGGRDAKFIGKAEKHPSVQKPWEGKFIIQAKHTENPIAKCSDTDFHSIVDKEKVKLKKLKENDEIDYYLIFTNRRLSANAETNLTKSISKDLEIESTIWGIEKINLILRESNEIVKIANLTRYMMPFQFYERDLKDIIIKFHKIKSNLTMQARKYMTNFKYLDLTKKNELNELSQEYFDFMKDNSFSYFSQIKNFLENPINTEYKDQYNSTVLDIQEQILLHRDEYVKFEELFVKLYNYIIDSNVEELRNNRKLVRIFLHYMYYNCDIGKKEKEV